MTKPPVDSPGQDPETERRRIQSGRNKVTALLLLAFVALVYAIAIVKLTK